MTDVLNIARRVFNVEAKGVASLAGRLTPDFNKAVELIINTPGKVITTGIGKSGLIASKITATFNSVGIYSAFLHPVEALHGDLGIVCKDDVVLALSYSGYSQELLAVLPILRQRGALVVALTGVVDSPLAKASDLVLDCGVEEEACPLNLVPTASTTATLAMGDALAVASMEVRGFQTEDFKRSHPGGKLGERLSYKVGQVMLSKERLPLVAPETGVQEAIRIMDEKDLGTILINSPENILLGIFTDGDLRRLSLLSDETWRNQAIGDVMVKNPKTISSEMLAADALHIMEAMQILALAVVDEKNAILGIVHLHDLLGRGQISFTDYRG